MTSDFDYKKYSLEKLETWVEDAVSGDASPQEIYDVIKGVVKEQYYYHKDRTSRAGELLALLNGNGKGHLSCDKDDKSPECQEAWNSFWEEYYYPENHTESTINNKEYIKAKIEANSAWNDGFTREYYQKIVDKYEDKQDKVKKWVLPVEEDDNTGEYFISFPDDLLEAANLKEGDIVDWVNQGNGSYLLKKHVERFRM